MRSETYPHVVATCNVEKYEWAGSILMRGSTGKEWLKEVTDETQNGRKNKGSLTTYHASGVSALCTKY